MKHYDENTEVSDSLLEIWKVKNNDWHQWNSNHYSSSIPISTTVHWERNIRSPEGFTRMLFPFMGKTFWSVLEDYLLYTGETFVFLQKYWELNITFSIIWQIKTKNVFRSTIVVYFMSLPEFSFIVCTHKSGDLGGEGTERGSRRGNNERKNKEQ